MIALVVESVVPYKRVCKGLARQKGELAGHFKVFNTIEAFNLDSMSTVYSHVAYYEVCEVVSLKVLGERGNPMTFIPLDDTESDNSNYMIYQPFPQLLEKLVDLARNKNSEKSAKKIRLCYRFIHERHQLYDVISKRHSTKKILIVDWIPVSHDEIFESEEDGLLTYHLINNKPFNIKDFKLIRNKNMTLYRPMLCFHDYSHFELMFPHKIHEVSVKSGFDLCLYVEHIGLGPCFDLEIPYGFEHQYILHGEGVEGVLEKSWGNENPIKACDSWERIFACIDENS